VYQNSQNVTKKANTLVLVEVTERRSLGC